MRGDGGNDQLCRSRRWCEETSATSLFSCLFSSHSEASCRCSSSSSYCPAAMWRGSADAHRNQKGASSYNFDTGGPPTSSPRPGAPAGLLLETPTLPIVRGGGGGKQRLTGETRTWIASRWLGCTQEWPQAGVRPPVRGSLGPRGGHTRARTAAPGGPVRARTRGSLRRGAPRAEWRGREEQNSHPRTRSVRGHACKRRPPARAP